MIGNFIQIVSELLNTPIQIEDLTLPRSHFSSWDSLTHIQLIDTIETTFSVNIPFEDIPSIDTLDRLLNYVKSTNN